MELLISQFKNIQKKKDLKIEVLYFIDRGNPVSEKLCRNIDSISYSFPGVLFRKFDWADCRDINITYGAKNQYNVSIARNCQIYWSRECPTRKQLCDAILYISRQR